MNESSGDLCAQISSLAAAHKLELDEASIQINEMGLDFRVAIAETTTGERWVLRIPRRSEVNKRAEVEGRVLELVAPALNVAVPDWQIHTSELIAYPILPGEPGLDLNDQGEPVWRAEVSASSYATSLGVFLSQLHAVGTEEAAATGVVVRNSDEVREAWRADVEKVAAHFEIAEHLWARWNAWLQEDSYWPQHSVLTHGEVYPGHTLVVDNEITGVLDWTTASVGDPARDFTFHQATATPEAFDLTVRRYVELGGHVWPRFSEHCAELFSANPVSYGVYVLTTGDHQHWEAAAAQLNPQPS